jgi:hypothetical protein
VKTPPAGVAPFTDTDVQLIAAQLGCTVYAEARLEVSREDSWPFLHPVVRLVSPHLMVPEQWHAAQLPDQPEITGRRILASLGSNVWVLSNRFLTEKDDTSDTLHHDLVANEVEWAEAATHRGMLGRFTEKQYSDLARPVWQGVFFGGIGLAVLAGFVLFITGPATRRTTGP